MSRAGFGGTYAAWIVAGLLIAIGLVAGRWVHGKYRKRRAWALINAEREDNKQRFRRAAEVFAAVAQQLQTNAAVLEPLRTRPEVPPENLAGRVVWNSDFPAFNDSAWQAVRRGGLTALMQPHQLREVEELYADFDVLRESMATVQRAIAAGTGPARVGSSESGPEWLAHEVEIMRAIRTAHEKLGADMRHFHRQHTDFLPSV